MSRSRKKTTVKKKTATSTPPQRRTSEASPDSFDDWAESLKSTTHRCSVCRDQAVADTVNALLQAMIRKRAHKITVIDIRKATLKHHPEADIGQRGMERHLRTCVRSLYQRARGRTNG